MYKGTCLFALIILVMMSCSQSFEAREQMNQPEYDLFLIQLAPYVIKKPDEFSYEERFRTENQPFYKNFIELTGAEVKFYYKTDTATFFFFEHRDLTSLYEHYRGLGGYLKQNQQGIIYLNLLYHTPRFTKEEMEEKGKLLFEEMIENGNVEKYLGDRKYVQTPNADFYYNTKSNRWDYTENSSWKFLEEAKESASADSIH